jgi:nucleoid DNA-binding protein
MRNRRVVETVAARAGVSILAARRAIWGTVEAIHQSLQQREPVTIYGLGTFRVKRATPRVIQSFGCGGQIVVGSRKISFLPSRALRRLK